MRLCRFFNYPKGNRLGLMSAAYFLPSVPSAFVGDYISTKYGRRTCVAIGIIIVVIGTFINGLAINIAMWIGGRATIGVGIGMAKVAAPVLIQETAHPRLRPILGSCYQTFAYIGGATAAFMTCEPQLLHSQHTA